MMNKESDEKISIKDRSLSFASETENETFGKFILQTNEIQINLAIIIFLYSLQKGKKYGKSLFKRITLGKLIGMFRDCTEKTTGTDELLLALKSYNKPRRIIAHGMYLSGEELSQIEAKQAIKIGKSILETLGTLIEKEHELILKIIKD